MPCVGGPAARRDPSRRCAWPVFRIVLDQPGIRENVSVLKLRDVAVLYGTDKQLQLSEEVS